MSAHIGSEVRLWSRHEGFTDPTEEPRLVHAVGATGAHGTGRKSWTVWLGGMRQEADISEITGQSSKCLPQCTRFLCWSFRAESSFSFVPGRAAGLASKMSPETPRAKMWGQLFGLQPWPIKKCGSGSQRPPGI